MTATSDGYRGILFDFDGTLADSESAHHAVWRDILADFDSDIDDAEYRRESAGLPVPQEAERLIRSRGLNIDRDALVSRKVERTLAAFRARPIALMPGALELLEWCRGRGLAMALVTGGGRSEVIASLEHHDLERFFDVVVTRNDVTHSKPHPESYLRALAALGLPAHHGVALEDTRHGVEAAHAAGVAVVAIPNDYSRGQDLSLANVVLDDLVAAQQWIETRRSEGDPVR